MPSFQTYYLAKEHNITNVAQFYYLTKEVFITIIWIDKTITYWWGKPTQKS